MTVFRFAQAVGFGPVASLRPQTGQPTQCRTWPTWRSLGPWLLGITLGAAALHAPATSQAAVAEKTPKAAPAKAAKPAPRHKAARHRAAPSAEAGHVYGQRSDVLAFADELAQQKGLDGPWLRQHLAQARMLPSVQRLIMPPPAGSTKNWAAYRARFVEPQRIQAGVAWWQANALWLDLAEQRWGVPPAMVVAIVGVETFYGRVTGNFRVLDALATLSFDFPTGRSNRSPFFRSELAAFLAWCAQEGRDPTSVRGSFAGAMGLPQFMPSSLQNHAVDMDGDGRIRLDDSPADVVGSVAQFLARHGWVAQLPTHFTAAPPADSEQRQRLLAADILPSFSASALRQAGTLLSTEATDDHGPLALVLLENGPDAAPSYVAGTRNFYVVTRYNWSAYYAMAVIDLAQALQTQRAAKPADARN